MKKFLSTIVIIFMLLFTALGANAGQYVSGLEGADTADLNDGFTLRMYNSLYTSDKIMDSNGDEIPFLNYDLYRYSTMLRAYYMTNLTFLGAKYGVSLGIPFGYTDVKINGFKSDNFGFGDMYIEPVILKWTQPRYDAFVTLGVFAPTGSFDIKDDVNIGNGYWTGMASLGGRVYLDEARSWSIFGVARYQMSTEQEDTHFQSGDYFTGEYGIMKSIPVCVKDKFTIGAVGYTSIQTTDNKYDYVSDINGYKSFTTAVGPAIGYHFDSIGLDVGAKAYFEVATENKEKGMDFILSVSKKF